MLGGDLVEQWDAGHVVLAAGALNSTVSSRPVTSTTTLRMLPLS